MRNGFAVAAFVLGILSILLGIFYVLLPFLIVVPVLAVVMGIIGLRRWPSSGGRVLAHLGLWFGVAILPWAAVFLISGIGRYFYY